MAVWVSVEKVIVSITAATEPVTVNLSKGQNELRCTPWFTQHHSGGVLDQHQDRMALVEIVDNSGFPAARITATERAEATESLDFEVFVVEWDSSINVQQISVGDFAGNTTTVAIVDVTAQADAFFMYSYQFTSVPSSDDDFNDIMVRSYFTGASTTEITLDRGVSGGTTNGVLYVVDCDASEWTVQHVIVDVDSTSIISKNSDAFTAVVMADTFILHSYETGSSTDDVRDGAWMADLNATTTVRVRRRSSAGTSNFTSDHNIQVVECNNNEWDVQRNDAVAMTLATITDTINVINESRTFLNLLDCMGHPLNVGRANTTTGTDNDSMQVALDFSSTTVVRFRKTDASVTDDIVSYEVIQFAALVGEGAGGPRGPLGQPLYGALGGPI